MAVLSHWSVAGSATARPALLDPPCASFATPLRHVHRTSTEQVRAARERLLRNPKAAAAHRALGEIARRLGLKRATLSEVRRAVGLTQKQLAQTLDMERGDLSKLERRQNLHLATLTRFIEATGGRLRITAVYGDTEVALDIYDVVPSRDTDVRA
jgi:DNA-binding XRE family transcriptional regulator